jgi:hypothetical protein
MALWVATFAGTAFFLMPVAYTAVVGKPLWELPAAGQADFALWSEIVEAFVTFAILANVASRWVSLCRQGRECWPGAGMQCAHAAAAAAASWV